MYLTKLPSNEMYQAMERWLHRIASIVRILAAGIGRAVWFDRLRGRSYSI